MYTFIWECFFTDMYAPVQLCHFNRIVKTSFLYRLFMVRIFPYFHYSFANLTKNINPFLILYGDIYRISLSREKGSRYGYHLARLPLVIMHVTTLSQRPNICIANNCTEKNNRYI